MIELSVLDRLEIIELQSIYAWGIDLRQGELFPQALTDDIVTEYPGGVKITGLDTFTQYMDAFHAPFDTMQHLIANPWVRVDGDGVLFTSYVQATFVAKGCPGGDVVSGGGYYVDRVVRTEAGWRIRSRNVTNVWRGGNQKIMDLGRRAVAHLV